MSTSLRMFGEAPVAGAHPTLAIARKGFRPFFLLAAAFAVAVLPIWMLALLGLAHPDGYLDAMSWHAHEMVFGFGVAVIAGFLLTAVGNWTQRETVIGTPLLVLAALWLAGRVALLVGARVAPSIVAALDLAFLPALAIGIGRPLVATRNRRNFIMLGVLAVLWAADVAVHLDVLGILPAWRRRAILFAVDVVVLLIALMAGRVFPMFTRNATGKETIRSHPRLDRAAAAGMVVVALADLASPDSPLVAIVAALTAILSAARAVHWGARYSLRVPLLWILHAGYAWIPIGLALKAAAIAWPAVVPATAATHAFTVGAIGGITLGMMARVSLGHSGRPLIVRPVIGVSFALVTFAALVRVATPILAPSVYRGSLFVAGTLWTIAFAIFLAVYAPILVSPRADGKAG